MRGKFKTEHEMSKNKGPKYWLRWLAVLPGAVLAGILATFFLHWILYSTLTKFIDPYPELPECLLTPFVMPAVFIWAGSRIAPHHKFKTSIVLFGLWLFLLGSFVFFGLTGANLIGYQLYFQDGGIRSIMALAGALTGLFLSGGISLVRGKNKKRRT